MTSIEQSLQDFIAGHESRVVDLSKDYALAYFQANASGKQEDFEKAAEVSLALNKIYADKDDFAKLKDLKDKAADISDPILKRELEILYNAYLGNQMDVADLEKIIQLEKEIETKFSTYRAKADGEEMSDNQINEVLRKSADSKKLEATWKASKQIGHMVAEDVLKLVNLRNQAAQKLGFKNFHEMSLKLNEQDPQEIEDVFDELDELTRDVFARAKQEMDQALARQYGITEAELMPWHFHDRFFQAVPRIYDLDLDRFFTGKDVIKITRDYYQGSGLPIDDLIQKSDLLERPGKYQHAYCMDVDKKGDIRVMASVKDNEYWMATMLHEFGHAAYDKYIDQSLPWTLRGANHIFTTEAVAMLFGRMTHSPAWLIEAAGAESEDAKSIAAQSEKYLKFNELIFTRWAQVVYRFEKSMYENTNQDLEKLWWDLVAKYQLLNKPKGWSGADWAAKVHIALYPAYYHNYVLGSLFASQIKHQIDTHVLNAQAYGDYSFAGKTEVGQYFIEKIFVPGKKLNWKKLVLDATGSELSPQFFADQILK